MRLSSVFYLNLMALDLELLLTCKIEINSGGKSHEKVRLNTAETSAGNQL